MANGDFMRILKDGKTYITAFLVGTVSYFLALFVTLSGIAPKTIKLGNLVQVTGAMVDLNVREQIVSGGYANPVGVKIIAVLTTLVNKVPWMDFMMYIGILLGSLAIVIVGRWIYTLKIVPKGKANWKLFVELVYGAAALYVLNLALDFFAGASFATAATMLTLIVIYYLVIAIVMLGIMNIWAVAGRYLNK